MKKTQQRYSIAAKKAAIASVISGHKTSKELADYLGVSKSTVNRWIKSFGRGCGASTYEGHWKIRYDDLKKDLANKALHDAEFTAKICNRLFFYRRWNNYLFAFSTGLILLIGYLTWK